MRKLTGTNKRGQMYWIALRQTDPAKFEELSLAYRLKNASKIRQRTRDWKKKNREKYNAWQRSAYERSKHGKEKES